MLALQAIASPFERQFKRSLGQDWQERLVDCKGWRYGRTSHHSGQRTLRGVRVAPTTIACSSRESRRSSRERACSTSHGSSAIRAVGR